VKRIVLAFKHIVLAFTGTASAGFLVFLVVNFFHPVANKGRFAEVIWQVSAFMAIVAGLVELRHRANMRLARRRAEGPSSLPDQFPEVVRASAVQPPQSATGSQVSRAQEVPGLTSLTDDGEHPVVFRPRGGPMLIVALLLAGIAAFYIWVLGVFEPGWLSGTLNVPDLAATGVALLGAALCFCFFVRSRLPGRRITVYSSGIILPGRIRVTWDVIGEIRLRKAWGIASLATVRMRLKDGRRIRISRNQIGCAPRKLCDAIRVCFEDHERRAQRTRHESERRGTPLCPLAPARPTGPGRRLSRS